MYNEKLIKEREVMVLQNLIFDEIVCWEKIFQEKTYAKDLLDNKRLFKSLEDMCTNINPKDVTDMKDEYKYIIIQLLDKRISQLKVDEDHEEELAEDIEIEDSAREQLNFITEFLIYEYSKLLNKFTESTLKNNLRTC